MIWWLTYEVYLFTDQDDNTEDLRRIINETLDDIQQDIHHLGKASAKVCRLKADMWEAGFIFDAYVYLGLNNPDQHKLFVRYVL